MAAGAGGGEEKAAIERIENGSGGGVGTNSTGSETDIGMSEKMRAGESV